MRKILIIFLVLSVSVSSFCQSYDNNPHVFNAQLWGASPSNSEANNTTAFTNCLTAIIAAGGGVMYIPAGTYLGKITIPDVPVFQNWVSIAIEGESPPIAWLGSAPASVTLPSNNTIIKSTSTSGAAVISAANTSTNFSWVNVYIKNILVRTQDNPPINAVDMGYAGGLVMENCAIDAGVYSPSVSKPWNGKAGIITPRIGNVAITVLKNVGVGGYWDGIIVNEHTNADAIQIGQCYHALNFQNMQHASNFGRVLAQDNVYNVYVTGTHTFTVQEFDTEYPASGSAWFNRVFDILDSANLGTADINWKSSLGGGGNPHSFTKSGGSGINTIEIGTAVAQLPNTNTFANDNTFSYSAPKLTFNATGGTFSNTFQFKKSGTDYLKMGTDIAGVGNADFYLYDNLRSKLVFYYDTNNGFLMGKDATSSSTAALVTNSSDNVIVKNNLGIGVTSPQVALHSSGNAIIGGSTGSITQSFSGFPTSYTPAVIEINKGASATSLYQNMAAINMVNNQTGTSTGVLGEIYFVNSNLGTTNKTLAFVGGYTSGATNSGMFIIGAANGGTLAERWRIAPNGALSNTVANGNAYIELKAGTATAGTAPLKFTTGTSLTSAVAGVMEYTTDDLFFTISTSTARKRILFADAVGGLTSGRVPYVTTNGRLTDASTMTFDGTSLTVGAANNIVGTATNNSAAAGNIGEEVNSTVSTYTNYTTTATYQNITSISLTAGDWDITAQGTYSTNSSTITAGSDAIFVISTTTASASGATEGKNIAYIPQAALLATSHESISIAPYRVSLSGTTTYYLNSQATFSIGNPQFVGTIRARRIR